MSHTLQYPWRTKVYAFIAVIRSQWPKRAYLGGGWALVWNNLRLFWLFERARSP